MYERCVHSLPWILISVTLNGWHSVSAASTPRPIVENMAVIAEAKASLSYCANTREGATALWQRMLELQVRVDSLIADIGNYYSDDSLYITYLIMEQRLLESSALALNMKENYPKCSEDFVSDMVEYVTEAETSWEELKALGPVN